MKSPKYCEETRKKWREYYRKRKLAQTDPEKRRAYQAAYRESKKTGKPIKWENSKRYLKWSHNTPHRDLTDDELQSLLFGLMRLNKAKNDRRISRNP